MAYTITETRIYRTTDGKAAYQLVAGTEIPDVFALALGLIEALPAVTDYSNAALRSDLDALSAEVDSLEPGGGIVLPAGTLLFAASSASFAFDDPAATALSPVVPAGSAPHWFRLVQRVAQESNADSFGIDIGTDADSTYFVNQGGVGAAQTYPGDATVAHLFEALASDTTVKVRYVETVGEGTPATAGEWDIVFYYALPPAS